MQLYLPVAMYLPQEDAVKVHAAPLLRGLYTDPDLLKPDAETPDAYQKPVPITIYNAPKYDDRELLFVMML